MPERAHPVAGGSECLWQGFSYHQKGAQESQGEHLAHRSQAPLGCKLHLIHGGVIATLWAPVQPVQVLADLRGGRGDLVA
jgi:hypothetical protein